MTATPNIIIVFTNNTNIHVTKVEIDMYKIGQKVKFNTNNEWNNLYGTIDDIFINNNETIISVFCIQFPNYVYHIIESEATNILDILE